MPDPYHVRLAISQYGDHLRAELFTEDLGDTEGDLLPASWDILEEWLPFLNQGAASLPPDAARKVGKQLFASLLGQAENAKKWTEILEQARRQGRPLRLLIDTTTERVRDLPYGLLCEPHDEYFLLRPSRAREAIQCVRILRRCTPRPFERFCRTTRQALRSALQSGAFDVLHVIAHGQNNGLPLCDAAGGKAEVTAGELGEWCGESRLQMAFLQVCRASLTDGRGGFGGLAQQLLNPKYGNLAAVVASPYPLDAERSTPAAIEFYRRLAAGKSPVEALDRGVEETDWTWAFLELWVRPNALGRTGARGRRQFAPPYRGLARFEEGDADIFFGREAEVAELLQYLRDEPVLAVIGDSGSGKSSLLHAGLSYDIRQHGLAGMSHWRIISLRPGGQPANSLMAALMPSAQRATVDLTTPEHWQEALHALLGDARSSLQPLLILFDQFEEVFTLCADEHEPQRRALTENLAEASQLDPLRFRLVLGLRTEYITQTVALPGLGKLIKRPYVLEPPGDEAVRVIIAKPAEENGYSFQGPLNDGDPQHQQGLLERILSDPLFSRRNLFASGSATASGPRGEAPLPLLEFALEQLWSKAVGRDSHHFTHVDYDSLGGLGGAIAQHADGVYRFLPTIPHLGPDPQKLAEQIFMSVITSQGTRRPRSRDDLAAETDDPAHAQRVIDHLVGERLLTIRSDAKDLRIAQVDIAHEVLIDQWGRLKEWLDRDRTSLHVREGISAAAREWEAGHTHETLLVHRGSRLEDAEGLVVQRKFHLNDLHLAYVTACVALREREKAAEEEQRRHELAQAQALAAEQQGVAEEQRRRAVLLAFVALFAAGAAGWAFRLRQSAQQNAELATKHAEESHRRRLVSVAQALAAQAPRQRDQYQRSDERSALLARHALIFHQEGHGHELAQVDSALRAVWSLPYFRPVLRGHARAVLSVAFSPDGRMLASGGQDKTIRIWATTETLADRVCEKVWRNLAPDEWRQFVGDDLPYERACPNLLADAQPARGQDASQTERLAGTRPIDPNKPGRPSRTATVWPYEGQIKSIAFDKHGMQPGSSEGWVVLARAGGAGEAALAFRPGTWMKRGDQLITTEELGIGNYVKVEAVQFPGEQLQQITILWTAPFD